MHKFEQLPILLQALSNRRWLTVCRCKQPTSNIFQMCLYCISLLKLYDKSIADKRFNQYLLGNRENLIEFCEWFIFAMWKGWNKLGRNKCTLNRWPRSPVMSDCSRKYQ